MPVSASTESRRRSEGGPFYTRGKSQQTLATGHLISALCGFRCMVQVRCRSPGPLLCFQDSGVLACKCRKESRKAALLESSMPASWHSVTTTWATHTLDLRCCSSRIDGCLKSPQGCECFAAAESSLSCKNASNPRALSDMSVRSQSLNDWIRIHTLQPLRSQSLCRSRPLRSPRGRCGEPRASNF